MDSATFRSPRAELPSFPEHTSPTRILWTAQVRAGRAPLAGRGRQANVPELNEGAVESRAANRTKRNPRGSRGSLGHRPRRWATPRPWLLTSVNRTILPSSETRTHPRVGRVLGRATAGRYRQS